MSCNPANVLPVGAMPDGQQCGPCADSGLDSDTLIELAESVQSITVDGQSITERSATDIIALDKYAAAKRNSCRSGGNAWGMTGKAIGIPPNPATGR